MKKLRKMLAVGGIAVGVCLLLILLLVAEENMRGLIGRWQVQRRWREQHHALTLAEWGLPSPPARGNAGEPILAAAKELEELSKANPIASAGANGLMSCDEPGRAVVRARGPFFPAVVKLEQPAKDGKKPVYEWSQAERELANAEQPLSRLRQALQQPAAALSVDYSNANARTESGPWKAFHWLSTAGLTALHHHDLDAATEDITAALLLGEYQRTDFRLAPQFSAMVIDLFTYALIWEALQADGWTDDQLARWQSVLAGARPLDAALRSVELEGALISTRFAQLRQSATGRAMLIRMEGHNLFEELLSDKEMEFPSEGVVWLRSWLWYAAWSYQDETRALTRFEDFLNHVRPLREQRSWTAFDHAYPPPTAHPKGLALWRASFSELFTPQAARSMLSKIVRLETQRQMTLAAVALKRYALRHGGGLPPSLGAMVPDLLPEVPTDLMDGQSLRYRALEDGKFLLYSVGTDGQDDGGDPVVTGKPRSRDLWNGRDMVWPTAIASP